MRRMLGRKDVLPGMIGAIQTHGELVHWHPLYLADLPAGRQGARSNRKWSRPCAPGSTAAWSACLCGARRQVDQSVYLPAGDQQGIERLVRYMTRCPFSLSRLVKVTETGIYRGGCIYGNARGKPVCYDYATGQVYWEERRKDGGFALLADEKLIYLTGNGLEL